MKLDINNPVVPFSASFVLSAISFQILDQIVLPFAQNTQWVAIDKVGSFALGGATALGVVGTAAATFLANNYTGKSVRTSIMAAFLSSSAFGMGAYAGELTSNAVTRATRGYNWEDNNFHPVTFDQSPVRAPIPSLS
jgi:uncharacterized membrane protein